MNVMHKRRLLFLWLSLIQWGFLQAQFNLSRSTARMFGSITIDVEDSVGKQIALPVWFPVKVARSNFRIAAMNRYGLKALTELIGQAQWTMGSTWIKGAIHSVGDAAFRTSACQIGWIQPLVHSWWMGMDLGFTQVRVTGYGSSYQPRAVLSFAGAFDATTWIGVQWENPHTWFGNKIRSSYAAPRVRAGMVRSVSDRLVLQATMEWERSSVAGLFVECVYRVSQNWSADLGWGRAPDQLVVGIERSIFGGTFRTAFSQDPVLGASFLCLYQINFRAKK